LWHWHVGKSRYEVSQPTGEFVGLVWPGLALLKAIESQQDR
jgi:hypothetical protein